MTNTDTDNLDATMIGLFNEAAELFELALVRAENALNIMGLIDGSNSTLRHIGMAKADLDAAREAMFGEE